LLGRTSITYIAAVGFVVPLFLLLVVLGLYQYGMLPASCISCLDRCFGVTAKSKAKLAAKIARRVAKRTGQPSEFEVHREKHTPQKGGSSSDRSATKITEYTLEDADVGDGDEEAASPPVHTMPPLPPAAGGGGARALNIANKRLSREERLRNAEKALRQQVATEQVTGAGIFRDSEPAAPSFQDSQITAADHHEDNVI
jgi:hypothetical protein